MIQISRSLVLVVVLGVLFNCCLSLRFDLESGHTKCISEDMKSNSMTVGKYHVVNPNDGAPLPDTHKVTVRVTSSYGNTYHSAERVESGQFAFTSAESGDYMACFWVDDHKPSATLTVDFDWKTGVAAKDWGTVAKKGSIDDEDVVALESCSRQWRMICSSDSVWYVLCHRRWPTLFSNESVLDQLKEQMCVSDPSIKGSISVSMLLKETSFCFVCSHLTSGQKEGDELRRNSDVMEILKKTRFPRVTSMPDEKSPETITEHE